jgi:ATP-dependent Clp protease ATP-binding subunit ClpA
MITEGILEDSGRRMVLPAHDHRLPDTDRQWRAHLSNLEFYLEQRIRGQRQAVRRVTQALQASALGLNAGSAGPRASFLFLGPTGVGKTETAKAFTEYLFGSRASLEMLFMNEYAAATRTPEFLSRLEVAIARNPRGATLVFDEIEKAHPQLIDLFLSLLDEGLFTTASGERLAVKPFYLVLTSNLGSGDLAKMESVPHATMERVALDVARQSLRPELFARITEHIVFRPLDLEVQKQIVDELIVRKMEGLSRYFGRRLTIARGPVAAFLLRLAYNKNQGARMLRQEVERQFNRACLPWALRNEVPPEGHFDYDPGRAGLLLR